MPISDLDGVHGRKLLSSLDRFTVSTDLPGSLSLPYTHVRLIRKMLDTMAFGMGLVHLLQFQLRVAFHLMLLIL